MKDEDVQRLLDELRQDNTAAHAETRQHFGETANRLSSENRQYFEVAAEAFRHQVQLIGENVLAVTGELRREATEIRTEMRTGFADTQAMIKFSHAELDRRVRTLEEKERSVDESLSALHKRIERLEAATH